MKKSVFSLVFIGLWSISIAQDRGELLDTLMATNSSLNHVLEKFNQKSFKRIKSLIQNISNRNEAQLAKIRNLENLLAHQINEFDLEKASLLNEEIQKGYSQFQQQIKQKLPNHFPYQPMIDSISGMVAFQKLIPGDKKELMELESQLESLKESLSRSEYLKTFSGERQSFLTQYLEKCENIPAKYKDKFLGEYSKQLAIYINRIEEWRKEINDPAKYEKIALLALNKLPAFKSFMQESGELSRLFGSPSSVVPNIAGLQTRQSLIQGLQQRYGTHFNAQQIVGQQLATAQGELNKAKEKLEDLKTGEISNGHASIEENTSHNTQKGKPFIKRLEYGINLQTGIRADFDFPAVNDLAILLGYKVNDRLVTGMGVAYKFGLGQGWKNISYSHEGIGIRSYLDYKISAINKGPKVLFSNLWLSGGYEQNYYQRFAGFESLKSLAWQGSGLIGISKKIQQGKKQFKMQVLWDFLSYKPSHLSQAIIFRLGYTF
jgi:hypothetical protein